MSAHYEGGLKQGREFIAAECAYPGEVGALAAICMGVLRSGVLPQTEAERIRGIVAACGEWAIASAKQTEPVAYAVAEINPN